VGFILAGVSHMPWRRFFAFDVAGALIWGVGHSVLGYALGEGYERWERYATPAGLGLLVVLVFLIVGSKLLARRRQRREELQGSGDPHDPGPALERERERD
jgi:membrane protein DedA with SNARE-associated domain